MSKWSTNKAGRPSLRRRFLKFISVISLPLGLIVSSQFVGAYYDHNPALGGVLIVSGDTTIYYPIMIVLWLLEFEIFSSKGMMYGAAVFGGFCVMFIVSLYIAVFSTNLVGEDAKGTHGTASWGDNTDVNLGLHQSHGVVLGKDDKGNFIVDNRQTHILISAATGGGKSTGPVICTLLNYPESIIVTDIKGELFSKTAGFRSSFSDVHVFDPLKSLAFASSTRINPLLDVMIGRESIQQCEIMAKSLIQAPNSQNADEHWSEKGREWVTALLLYILYCEKIDNVHLGRLYDLLVKGASSEHNSGDEGDGFGELMRDCEIAPYKKQEDDTDEDYERIQKELAEVEEYIHSTARGICAMNDREAASIISTMTRNLNAFRNPSIVRSMNASTFSLRDFLTAERPQTLYVASPPQDLPVVAPVIRVLFELTSRIIMEKEPDSGRLDGKNRR